MRYVGQNFELAVPIGVAVGGKLPAIDRADAMPRRASMPCMNSSMASTARSDPVEIINVRLTASAAITSLKRRQASASASSSRPKPSGHRPVWFTAQRAAEDTGVTIAPTCFAGQTIIGPAIIEQFDSTTVLYPKDRLTVDDAMQPAGQRSSHEDNAKRRSIRSRRNHRRTACGRSPTKPLSR